MCAYSDVAAQQSLLPFLGLTSESACYLPVWNQLNVVFQLRWTTGSWIRPVVALSCITAIWRLLNLVCRWGLKRGRRKREELVISLFICKNDRNPLTMRLLGSRSYTVSWHYSWEQKHWIIVAHQWPFPAHQSGPSESWYTEKRLLILWSMMGTFYIQVSAECPHKRKENLKVRVCLCVFTGQRQCEHACIDVWEGREFSSLAFQCALHMWALLEEKFSRFWGELSTAIHQDIKASVKPHKCCHYKSILIMIS